MVPDVCNAGSWDKRAANLRFFDLRWRLVGWWKLESCSSFSQVVFTFFLATPWHLAALRGKHTCWIPARMELVSPSASLSRLIMPCNVRIDGLIDGFIDCLIFLNSFFLFSIRSFTLWMQLGSTPRLRCLEVLEGARHVAKRWNRTSSQQSLTFGYIWHYFSQ